MPITVEWDNDEQSIMRSTYEDPITVNELRQSADEAAALLDSVFHPVAAIIDATQVTVIPRDMLASFPLLARERGFNHPNLRAAIMVVNNTLFESLLSVFGRLYGKLRPAHSLDDAYELIRAGKV